ncbi:hypothetical protein D3C74_352420 [compost metagenome]
MVLENVVAENAPDVKLTVDWLFKTALAGSDVTCTLNTTVTVTPGAMEPSVIPVEGFAPGRRTPSTDTLPAVRRVLAGTASVKITLLTLAIPLLVTAML